MKGGGSERMRRVKKRGYKDGEDEDECRGRWEG
jgi:hypothetical protein